MVRRIAFAAALACPLAFGSLARAAQVKVEYLVDLKAFKAGAVATTPLTFSLFTDSACAGTAAATQVLNAGDVQGPEQLKLAIAKGALKPPLTGRMSAVLSGVTAAPLFYLQVTGSGITPVGGACQLQQASVNGSAAVVPPPPPPTTCAPDASSVGSGTPCVDRYEASVWDVPSGNTTLIQKVKDGTVTLADLTGGGATQVSATPSCAPSFPGSFPSDGRYTAPLYAVSVPGVKPTVCLTAYQAQVACQISGKRLLTSAEWLTAATGTPDANTDDGSTDCNTGAPPVPSQFDNVPANTGSRSACVSPSGMYDAIGNVGEMTVDPVNDILTGVPSVQISVHGGVWYSGASASVSNVLLFDAISPVSSYGFRCGR